MRLNTRIKKYIYIHILLFLRWPFRPKRVVKNNGINCCVLTVFIAVLTRCYLYNRYPELLTYVGY